MFERHGRHGIDYDESQYPGHEADALTELDQRLAALIADDDDDVLDYGFWSKEQRDRYKRLIEKAGGRWRLIYFKVELAETPPPLARAQQPRRRERAHRRRPTLRRVPHPLAVTGE